MQLTTIYIYIYIFRKTHLCATIVKCTLSRIVYPGISADQTSRKRRSDTFSGTEEEKEDVDRFIMYLAVRRFRLSLHNERKFLLPHLPLLPNRVCLCFLRRVLDNFPRQKIFSFPASRSAAGISLSAGAKRARKEDGDGDKGRREERK